MRPSPKYHMTHIQCENGFHVYRPAPDRQADREAFRFCRAQDLRQRAAKIAAKMPAITMQIEDEEPRREDTAAFLSANDYDEGIMRQLEDVAFRGHDGAMFGGGAAPLMIIRSA